MAKNRFNIGTDTVIGFKRVEFNDGTLALDIDPGDTAGQAYRLYQAAFAELSYARSCISYERHGKQWASVMEYRE